jgi:hypothetical protein
MPVYSTTDMKSGFVEKHNVCQKVGVSANSVKHVRQNCVTMGCPLVSARAEFAPCTHRDTTAFREPCAQLLVAFAVPINPDELTSLDFG